MKKILLTFDYEVFLYRSGSAEKCMLEPTDLLLELYKKHKVKATFFVDILYLWQLQQYGLTSTYQKIEDQMRRMVAEEHRVELHLHPQWLECEYKNEEWTFGSMQYYRLQELEKAKAEELFQIGLDIINGIAQKEDQNYQVFSFRAGGLCIQPFEPLKDIFQKFNLTVDSSVTPGLSKLTSNLYYDFTNAPNKGYYRFENDPAKEEKGGQFLQIPITTYDRTLPDKFFEKQNRTTENIKIYGDGQGISLREEGDDKFFNKLKAKVSAQTQIYSFDLISSPLTVKKLLNEKRNLITILSHPKLLNPNSLSEMKRLFESGGDIDFLNIGEAVDKVLLEQ